MTDLEGMKRQAVAAAQAAATARRTAQSLADYYVQAREPVKVGDEIEVERTGFHFLICRVIAPYLDPLERGRGEEPQAYFVGRRILKDRTLGEIRHVWDIDPGGKGCTVVGRYAPPEPTP